MACPLTVRFMGSLRYIRAVAEPLHALAGRYPAHKLVREAFHEETNLRGHLNRCGVIAEARPTQPG